MSGTSGFQEVRSSTSRSPAYRLLHEQQPQFGTGCWPLLSIHNLITLSTGITTKREKPPDTIFMLPIRTNSNSNIRSVQVYE